MTHGNLKRDTSPASDHRIKMGKRVVYFTFGYMFGPLVTDGYGQPTTWQPTSENSKFWPPFEAWLAEYQKTNPPPPLERRADLSDKWDVRP